uniref:Coluporin-30 n=1 Tax=Colubraria reticulata TaxID=604273 RepID=A0A499RIY0_9CAEN|nr:coluporin-30 [Colubraria reticulata]
MVLQFPRLKTVLMICVFVIVTSRKDVVAKKTPYCKRVTDGSSLKENTLKDLKDLGYWVGVVIQVENWTRYPLLYPTVRLSGGTMATVPTTLLPCKREAFMVRKASFAGKGSYGTVSWEVYGANRLFVIMWSAPYNFDFYSNWLGLGMTKKGHTTVASGETWFDQMYDGNSDSNFEFHRKEYDDTEDPLTWWDSEFHIRSVMTTEHNAQVNVTFK